MKVQFQVVSPLFEESYLPKYATDGSAGMDLHACIESTLMIAPLERVRIPTGVALGLPGPDTVALVYARSGLAWRHGLGLPNGVGVIDSDYTGEVQVLLTNFGEETVTIEPGDRVAQVVFAPVFVAELVQVDALAATERGKCGFGSTGV